MKIKQRPEDFVVQEAGAWQPRPDGAYGIYRLSKRGIGTLDAVTELCRGLHIPQKIISFGGLKDRHSVSDQIVSIRGERREFRHPRFHLTFLGRSAHPYDHRSFSANRFTITVRDLTAAQAVAVRQRLDQVKVFGIPNYYDDQRFGSLRGTKEFIARRLIAGDCEGALQLAIATPSAEDQKMDRNIKRTIQTLWGDWPKCKAELPRCSERSIVTYLVDHPDDFANAFDLLNRNLKILYLSAYQSYLWNRLLSDFLAARCGRDNLFPYPFIAGEFFLYESLPPDLFRALSGTTIPLPMRSTTIEDPALGGILERVMASQGLAVRDLRIKALRKAFFSKGQRKAVVMPGDLAVTPPSDDDLNRGKVMMTLTFDMPRGTYATILIKRLTHDMENRRANVPASP